MHDYLAPRAVRVGICASVRPQELSFGVTTAHTVLAPYVTAVLASGAVPLVLPCVGESGIAQMLLAVDAVVLTGGPDLGTDIARDQFELALARTALAAQIPMLGICRGLQIINVGLGGTVVPHVDGHLGGAVRHLVDVAVGSQLAEAVGTLRLSTGSLHHQAVDRLGTGLCVTARADDGTVEAVEKARVLAVQWHPELECEGAGALLFEWLASIAGATRCGSW